MKTSIIENMFIPIICICTIGLCIYGMDIGNDKFITYTIFIGISIATLFLCYEYSKIKLQNER